MKELRPYQKKAMSQITTAINNGTKKICLTAPTAFGKSIIIANLVKEQIDNYDHIIVMTNISALVYQLDELLSQEKIEHNIVKATDTVDVGSRVHLIMQQTAHAREWGADMIGRTLLIIDEYHISYGSTTMNALIGRVEPSTIVGLSATPMTAQGIQLDDDIVLVESTTVKELTEQKFLAPVRTFVGSFSQKMNYDDVAMSGSDYSEVQLSKIINTKEYNSEVVNCWKQVADNKKTIVFCSGIEHAEAMAQEFRDNGVQAKTIHSKKSGCDVILEEFRANKFPVLVSVSMLTVGFDVPDIECGICCRPTKVYRLAVQMIGRICRIAEGKESAMWLDFAQITENHGLYDDELVIAIDKKSRAKVEEKRAISNFNQLLGDEDVVELEPNRVRLESEITEILREKRKGTVEDLYSILMSSNNLNEIISLASQLDKLINKTDIKLSTEEWVISKWEDKFNEYPSHKKMWTKALKTKIKNTITKRQKFGSIGYFIDFLVSSVSEPQW